MAHKDPPRESISSAFLNLASLSFPNMIIYILDLIIDLIGMFFVGRVESPSCSAGIRLGMLWYGMAIDGILIGFAVTLDTFISQCFGMKAYRKCGLYLFKGIIMFTILAIPLAFLLYSGYFIMRYFVVDQEVVRMAGDFNNVLIPGIFLSGYFELHRNFLNSQKIVKPTVVIIICATGFHIFITYLLVMVYRVGFLGAAYSILLTKSLALLCIMSYAYFSSNTRKTRTAPTLEVFKDWLPFIWIALPSTIMGLISSSVTNIGGFLLASVPGNDFFVYACLVQISRIVVCGGVATGASAGVLIGNHFGRHRISSGLQMLWVSQLFSSFFSIPISIIVYLRGDWIGYIFSKDLTESNAIAEFCPLMSIYIFTVFHVRSVMRSWTGLGLQKQASMILFLGNVLILTPLYFIIIKGLNKGLAWVLWAMIFARGLNLAILGGSQFFYNYEVIAEKIEERERCKWEGSK